ncbi:hypothetical protein NMY22_g19124 [Coprinellus aureogranulatus]|nr:hypothetical protein NMY22_g19124 [Coprinellus aureogranulatus]
MPASANSTIPSGEFSFICYVPPQVSDSPPSVHTSRARGLAQSSAATTLSQPSRQPIIDTTSLGGGAIGSAHAGSALTSGLVLGEQEFGSEVIQASQVASSEHTYVNNGTAALRLADEAVASGSNVKYVHSSRVSQKLGSYVRLSSIDVQLRTSEHRSCTATYV